MKLVDTIKPEKRKAFCLREKVLKREVEILNEEVQILLEKAQEKIPEELEDLELLSTYESAVVRAAKLIRNSGYTFDKLRRFIRQNVLKEHRYKVYPLLDSLENLENETISYIEQVKRCRDRTIVHLDPRFAFNLKRYQNNLASLEALKNVTDYLLKNIELLFEREL